MDKKAQKRISKYLSLILRHRPEVAGLVLDHESWVEVETLLKMVNQKAGKELTLPMLRTVVTENDKKRFEFNGQGTMIRASQGHSVKVDLGYSPATPPDMLFHGTVARFIDAIRREGLSKMNRHHVHLSSDLETAQQVGQRRGTPIVLKIDTKSMLANEEGYAFFISANDVWLTDHVPPEFIVFPSQKPTGGSGSSQSGGGNKKSWNQMNRLRAKRWLTVNQR